MPGVLAGGTALDADAPAGLSSRAYPDRPREREVPVYTVTILTDSLDRVTALRGRGLDLHERAARRRPGDGEYAVPALLSDEQIAELRADGYRVTVHEDAERLAVERSGDVAPDVNRFSAGPPGGEPGPDRGAPPPGGTDEESAARTLERLMDPAALQPGTDADRGTRPQDRAVLGGYLTPEEVESALHVLAAGHPGVASVQPLPERSWGGRTSHVLRLGTAQGPARTGVLVTGGMHAREWGGSDVCIAFATNLLRSYEDGSELRYGDKVFAAADVRAVLQGLDVFVFPDVNPDGKAYSQAVDPGRPQGFWWRKNRRPAGTPGGAEGVDLNRNFDFLWDSGIGTASDPAQSTYKGPSAFSEPEARNVRWLLDTHPGIRCFADVHAFGELILYSWGDDENQVDVPGQNFTNPAFDGLRGVVGDDAYREFIRGADQTVLVEVATGVAAAVRDVRGTSYTVDQAVGLYPTSATSDDYAFSRHLADTGSGTVYGFTIEIGQQFVPPYAEMRMILADVAAGLTELCRRAAGGCLPPVPPDDPTRSAR